MEVKVPRTRGGIYIARFGRTICDSGRSRRVTSSPILFDIISYIFIYSLPTYVVQAMVDGIFHRIKRETPFTNKKKQFCQGEVSVE